MHNVSIFFRSVRPTFLFAFWLALACSLGAESPKKNILIFFIDDLRPELGCYGETYIQTPHIDRLASQGVTFDRAYCQQAICAPSRISMLTGRYPYRIGIQDLFTPLRRTIPDVLTMPGYFKEAGYKTLSYGKVYHHGNDDAQSWDDLPRKPGETYANPDVLESIRLRTEEAKKEGLSDREMFARTRGPASEKADVADEVYRDGAVALQAIEALNTYKDDAFFMCVGFAKPHLPFAAPARYWDLYQREDFEVPDRALPEGAPAIAFTTWGELRSYHGMPKEGFLDDETTRELRHGYAASVSFMDAQVGKVLDELDRLGLRENTIVLLWGDHGYKLGDHGQWCKHTNFELDARVPFIVSAPAFSADQKSSALVEMVDIFPTLIELTGGDIPESIDGRSLTPVLQNPENAFRPFAFSEYRRGRNIGFTLRDDRWRYTEWVNIESGEVNARELYDHAATQLSPVNLAEDPQNAELVARLSAQLDSQGRLQAKSLRELAVSD